MSELALADKKEVMEAFGTGSVMPLAVSVFFAMGLILFGRSVGRRRRAW